MNFKSKKQSDKEITAKNNQEVQAFLKEYADLVRKHHKDFDAVLDFSNKSALLARLIVVDYTPPSGIVVPENKIVTAK